MVILHLQKNLYKPCEIYTNLIRPKRSKTIASLHKMQLLILLTYNIEFIKFSKSAPSYDIFVDTHTIHHANNPKNILPC